MDEIDGAVWPYGETVEVLERRDRRREIIREIAFVVLTFAGAIATWQGLEWYAVATYAA